MFRLHRLTDCTAVTIGDLKPEKPCELRSCNFLKCNSFLTADESHLLFQHFENRCPEIIGSLRQLCIDLKLSAVAVNLNSYAC